ncbi:MAG: diguanylate cyclase [Planctomycetes bacterium]|nr:diguanylate cyclase [Planctomycetota bacterium]
MYPEKIAVESSINQPVPILKRLESDQLATLFGTCLADAVFLLDSENGHLVAANQKLLSILGRDLEELEEEEIPFSRFLHREDRCVFQTWLRGKLAAGESTFEVNLIDSSGFIVPVEITLRSIRWRRAPYHLGFVRPCSERQQREARLKREVELQKNRAFQALRSSLRVYELNEKIKSTLELTATLLDVENEEQLYQEALRILTNTEGLNFREVSFLILEDKRLKLVCSTEKTDVKYILLAQDNKYSRCVRKGFSKGGDEPLDDDETILVPLHSREALLGIIEVSQYSRERAFFEDHRLLSEWQRDILFQIGDVIALLLDNLRLKRELKRQSIMDSLTGAYNRNFFMGRLDAEVSRASRYCRCVSMVFLDVDYFKLVNDKYGHLQGDYVLHELGKLFRSVLRETDILCRYGGDEFVVLLPEADEATASRTAVKILATVRSHAFNNLEAPEERLPITVSAGTSTLRPGQSAQSFLQEADAALYRAKTGGRDRVACEKARKPEHGLPGDADVSPSSEPVGGESTLPPPQ